MREAEYSFFFKVEAQPACQEVCMCIVDQPCFKTLKIETLTYSTLNLVYLSIV